jgi:broad specificity phosphatase PhoE
VALSCLEIKEKTITRVLCAAFFSLFLLGANCYANEAEKEHYILRHGQIEANVDGSICGQCPISLTDAGIAQIEETARYIKENNIGICHIIHGGLPRTRETAEIINNIAFDGVLTMSVDDRIQGTDMGGLEQSSRRRAYWCKNGAIVSSLRIPRLLQYAGVCPKNLGESSEVFVNRVVSGLNESHDIPCDSILYVTHAYVMKTILGNGDAKFVKKVKNGELLRLKYPENSEYKEALENDEAIVERVYVPTTS